MTTFAPFLLYANVDHEKHMLGWLKVSPQILLLHQGGLVSIYKWSLQSSEQMTQGKIEP